MITTFYIFRHGETIWNVERRPQGQTKELIPLTLNGVEQAKRITNFLYGENINVIASSDLLRAQQTAEIVADKLGLNIIFDEDLREVDYGKLNGLYHLERLEICPNFADCYSNLDLPFPEGESFNNAVNRVERSLINLAKNNDKTNIAVVTHANVIDYLFRKFFNKKVEKIDNCTIFKIAYNSETEHFIELDLSGNLHC